MLVQVASRLGVGDILEEVVDGIRFGRLWPSLMEV